MSIDKQSSSSYIRKLFIFNHGAGLLVGSCFPFVAYLMVGYYNVLEITQYG